MLMEVCKANNLEPDKVIVDNDYKILYWDWIKWYDFYEEVKNVNKCMACLDTEHKSDSGDMLGYSFIRLGENGDDVEEFTNDYDIPFGYVRKIDLPEPVNEKEKKKQRVKNMIDEIKDGVEKTAEQIAEVLDEIF